MSSFVIIEFDRTPPTIEIYTPSYTTKDIVNEIVIKSNEDISTYQEIYIIDSNDNRVDYTFKKESNNTLVGFVKLSQQNLGIATIYARVKDDVGNYSNLAQKSINIRESLTYILRLEINDYNMYSECKDRHMASTIEDSVRMISVSDRIGGIN